MSHRTLAAVIGSPVAHSLSPVIHLAGFASLGVDWGYAAFDVAAGKGGAAVEAMRTLGLAGLSVTTPHKEAVAAAVDRLDPAAASLHSVNTVAWDGDDLVGSSTDGAGFVASVAEAGVAVEGAVIALLGCGAAARSLVDALGRAGAAEIAVIGRTPASVEAAAALAECAAAAAPDAIARAALVVNATTVGMGVAPHDAGDDDLPCDPATIEPHQVVADLVYHPRRTALLDAAAARGARTVDGLGMLVHQAALQQQAWIGRMPDVAAMRTAAEAELDRRAG